MTSEEHVTYAWIEALVNAYLLARGERLGELRARRAKAFDERGLHPYSLAWGEVFALEEVLPELAGARLSDPMCDPVTLRRIAQADAQETFYDELTTKGAGAWHDGTRK